MGAIPIQPRSLPQENDELHFEPDHQTDWKRIRIGGTLLTGAFLLMAGKRKAGLIVTMAGTALAMLEEREVVARWWNALPGYLDTAQDMLVQAHETIDDLTAKRDRILSIFGRECRK
ncbi:MAG TPA: hypothetical protein VKB38_18925 [Terracidiphilus sp.]|nr:hypothetical protein [Terracidiphilus sp.]